MSTHLFYVTSATFPSQLANRKQIVNQMRAFSQLAPNVRTTLAIAQGKEELQGEPFTCVVAGTRSLLLLVWRHIRSIRREKATHVYCREPRVFALLVLARKLHLLRISSLAFEIHSLAIDATLLRLFLNQADCLVAVNPVLAENAARMIGDVHKILVAHDAADPNVFMVDIDKNTARRELSISMHDRVAVYTGRFRTIGMDKGLLNVMRVLPQLAAGGTPVHVYAVGGTDEELAAYAASASALHAAEYITFVPYQPQDKVALYHAAADMLLMPFPRTAHFAQAMSPLKLFEYLMAGRPVIASNLPSIADVLKTGATMVIEPDSDIELLEAMRRLSIETAYGDELGKRARSVSHRYTWDVRARVIAAHMGMI